MEAEYGEILTTCEKIRHLIRNGESDLKPESRSPPLMLFLKKVDCFSSPLCYVIVCVMVCVV